MKTTIYTPLSIVVPALNEAENLPLLVKRIAASLKKDGIEYEIILLDDHSTDNTAQVAQRLAKNYNVRHIMKVGKRGKAFSLLEAFSHVRYPLICMIDADLQYPPEAIIHMYRKLQAHNADIVVTNRIDQKTSPLRRLSTKVSHFLLARLLFGIDYDTQSGLKLFKQSVLEGMELHPSAWSFDLEFLIRSLEKHCTILSYEIPFGERLSGETKVKLLSGTYAVVTSSLKLRMNSSVRKVRHGYRASLELSKRPYSLVIAFVAGAILSSAVMSAQLPSQAAALSLTDVRHAFSANNDKAQPAQQTPTEPAATAPAAAQPTPSTPVAEATPSSKPPQSTAVPQSATPQTTASRAANTTKPVATNSTQQPNYYPGYGLDAHKTNTLLKAAITLAISGAVAVAIAIITAAIRSAYRRRARRVSHRIYQASDF